jgi:hypothetical protein
MTTPTAPEPVSPQGAVLSMFRNDRVIEQLLNRKQPIRYTDLATLAERSGLTDLAADLNWLQPAAEAQAVGQFDASVLVVDRERWLGQINRYERIESFPDGLVVAAVIDVAWADRCIVLPKRIGEPDDAVMLYGRSRFRGLTALIPIALRRESATAGPVVQPCVLQEEPEIRCLESGCTGVCMPRTAMEDDVEVVIGCLCT